MLAIKAGQDGYLENLIIVLYAIGNHRQYISLIYVIVDPVHIV
jgi:hypothetical protein